MGPGKLRDSTMLLALPAPDAGRGEGAGHRREPPEGAQHCRHLDVTPGRPSRVFQPAGL